MHLLSASCLFYVSGNLLLMSSFLCSFKCLFCYFLRLSVISTYKVLVDHLGGWILMNISITPRSFKFVLSHTLWLTTSVIVDSFIATTAKCIIYCKHFIENKWILTFFQGSVSEWIAVLFFISIYSLELLLFIKAMLIYSEVLVKAACFYTLYDLTTSTFLFLVFLFHIATISSVVWTK